MTLKPASWRQSLTMKRQPASSSTNKIRLLDIKDLSRFGCAVEPGWVIGRVQVDKGDEAIRAGEVRADGDPCGRGEATGRLEPVLCRGRTGERKGHAALSVGFQGEDIGGHHVNQGGTSRGTRCSDRDAKGDGTGRSRRPDNLMGALPCGDGSTRDSPGVSGPGRGRH